MSLESKKDQVKGKINEEVGKATGDDKKELKGKAEGLLGKAKDKLEDLGDKVAKKINNDD
ncbi:CsbD family protein [Companilactobacillus sp. DQM5]|uniref:CsbD family protein n=1 Tax=Companilactobacillus sp. DQM5 TaxID=3463359 RepID=UPI0040590C75